MLEIFFKARPTLTTTVVNGFKLMSLLKYDAVTIGNHDFDNGIDGLNNSLMLNLIFYLQIMISPIQF